MITISERANNYILRSGIKEIRFGVRPNKGCAGFEYIWEAGEYQGGDYQLNFNNKFTLLITEDSKKYVENCIVDLKDVDDGTGFKIEFINEKVEVKCGCGESLDFPEDIEELEPWQRTVSVAHMYSEADYKDVDFDKMQTDPDYLKEYTEKFLNTTSIDEAIKGAGDTVKRVDPKNLTDKYRDWRK